MDIAINPVTLFVSIFTAVLLAGAFTLVRETPRVRARYGFHRVSTAGIRVELAGLAAIAACVVGAVL